MTHPAAASTVWSRRLDCRANQRCLPILPFPSVQNRKFKEVSSRGCGVEKACSVWSKANPHFCNFLFMVFHLHWPKGYRKCIDIGSSFDRKRSAEKNKSYLHCEVPFAFSRKSKAFKTCTIALSVCKEIECQHTWEISSSIITLVEPSELQQAPSQN